MADYIDINGVPTDRRLCSLAFDGREFPGVTGIAWNAADLRVWLRGGVGALQAHLAAKSGGQSYGDAEFEITLVHGRRTITLEGCTWARSGSSEELQAMRITDTENG